MKKVKIIFLFIIVAIISIAFCACGDKEKDTGTQDPSITLTEQEIATNVSNLLIGYIKKNASYQDLRVISGTYTYSEDFEWLYVCIYSDGQVNLSDRKKYLYFPSFGNVQDMTKEIDDYFIKHPIPNENDSEWRKYNSLKNDFQANSTFNIEMVNSKLSEYRESIKE